MNEVVGPTRAAAGVVLLSVATIASGQLWITALIAYGFVARVLTGPTLSPLGLLVTNVITPRLPVEPHYVPGPPKRFARESAPSHPCPLPYSRWASG